MIDEWGEWQIHDGKGCPCVGKLVEIERANGFRETIIAWQYSGGGHADPEESHWARLARTPVGNEIIRYCIRKPRGMTILEGLLENLPQKVDS